MADEFGFKFAIGDTVQFIVTREDADRRNGKEGLRMSRPQLFSVVERRLDQCYGGIQRHYSLRGAISSSYIDNVIGVVGTPSTQGLLIGTEIELEPAAQTTT